MFVNGEPVCDSFAPRFPKARIMRILIKAVALAATLGLVLFPSAGWAASHGHDDTPHEHSASGHAEPDDELSGLMMPIMNPARGRLLFASKGCVACHAVNGVGGQDAPPMDAETMPRIMNPFSFAARMWRGAETMILLQQEIFGEQIDMTGQELADIISFVHNAEEQQNFSEADIPHEVLELIEHTHGGHDAHEHAPGHDHD